MYRQSVAMKEKEIAGEEGAQFLLQVGSLPVVNSAMGQLVGMYARTKGANRLVRFTLETAESGVSLAVNTAKPIINRLPVERLNDVACTQLDHLKESYPIITKPTDQVLADTMGLYEATLKPTVDRVSAVRQSSVDGVVSVKQYGVDKVTGVTTYTKGLVSGATQYSLSTLIGVKDRGVQTVGALLQTPYGQVVAARVDGVVNLTDTYVDKYLPATEEDTQNGGMEVDTEAAPQQAGTTLARVGVISDKVRRRTMNRALRELKHVRVRSQETLSKLNFTVDLIQFARDNLDSVKSQVTGQVASVSQTASHMWGEMNKTGGEGGTVGGLRDHVTGSLAAAQARLGHIWTEINKTEEDLDLEDEAEGDESDASKLERRTIATARHLTRTLKNMFNSLTTTVMVLPSIIQDKVQEAGSISETLGYLFSSTKVRVQDIPQITLDNARMQLDYMQELLKFLADTTLDTALKTPAFNWMVPDLELDSLGMDIGFEQEGQDPSEATSPAVAYVPCQLEEST